ncbi:MAG TPA: adenosylmethionine--8-amino-7-oxononanoate transaminase [Polyangia bacterium]|nr:adenosylmethionine--8-amino-7-oxononanoate transaminase [Polyangia bacterium]
MSTIADLDRQYVWHPFTQMRDWISDDPLVIERAQGNYLFDQVGRRYLDGVSSLWVTVHGHRRPEIDDAIRSQLDRVAHTTLLGLASPPAAQLAERLIRIAPPGLAKVFYSDSGSTAVEVALKMAYQYFHHRGRSRKLRFVALEQAYHGDTLGAVSVGGIELFHQLFAPLLMPCYRIPSRADALAALLAEHADQIAALIVEPIVQAAAGIQLAPTGFLRDAAELCRQHDVLLIADEVATGFGRTGRMFACEHEGVTPDLMALAKGLTGGYLPLAATLATQPIFDAFLGAHADRKTFFHGHTYTGNALACAAALASLDLFERDQVLARLPDQIARLQAELGHHILPLRAVAQIRHKGLMVGIELGPFRFEEATGARVCRAARRHGVILRPLGDVIVLMPPLSITLDEIGELVAATRAAIVETCA